MVDFYQVMNLYYLTPFLCIPAVAVAAAAEQSTAVETVQNAEALMAFLKSHENPSREEARELLLRLPLPLECSRPLRARLEFYKSIPLLVKMCEQGGAEGKENRQRLLKISPRMWVICSALEMLHAKEKGDTALQEALQAELETGLQGIAPEQGMGVVQALSLSFLSPDKQEKVDAAEEAAKNRRIAEALEGAKNGADAQLALAMMHLYEQMGLGVDVGRAMQHALRGAVAEMYLLQDKDVLRNSLRLTLARAAVLKGEAALPLQVAALLQPEKEDKSTAGLCCYRLAKLYGNLPETCDVASEELAQAVLVAGAELGDPACLHELAEGMEGAPERENLQKMAEQAGFDPEKDYLNGEHGRKASLHVSYPAVEIPDATERLVSAYCNMLVARAEASEWMAAGVAQSSQVMQQLSPILVSFLDMLTEEGKDGLSVYDEDEADSQEADDEGWKRFFDRLQQMLGRMNDAELSAYVDSMSEGLKPMLQQLGSQEEISEEQLEFWQKLADAGQEDAIYLLAWRQVSFTGEFTQESWTQMADAARRGSGDAAWFLFNALWEELYGLQRDPMSASACYRRALACRSIDAWKREWNRAEDDAGRLYALVHMNAASGGEKYGLELDDALQAYGAAHPELQSIISPLRLLCIGQDLRRNTSSPEQNYELRTRALQLATTLNPPVLLQSDLDFRQRHAEFVCRKEKNGERTRAAHKALPVLQEGKADILLVAEGKITYEQLGQDTATLSAEQLKGAHLVCRECNRALADFAIQAGVRSVTAMRMPAAERSHLRAHNISAGGWEITE